MTRGRTFDSDVIDSKGLFTDSTAEGPRPLWAGALSQKRRRGARGGDGRPAPDVNADAMSREADDVGQRDSPGAYASWGVKRKRDLQETIAPEVRARAVHSAPKSCQRTLPALVQNLVFAELPCEQAQGRKGIRGFLRVKCRCKGGARGCSVTAFLRNPGPAPPVVVALKPLVDPAASGAVNADVVAGTYGEPGAAATGGGAVTPPPVDGEDLLDELPDQSRLELPLLPPDRVRFLTRASLDGHETALPSLQEALKLFRAYAATRGKSGVFRDPHHYLRVMRTKRCPHASVLT